MSNAVKGEPEEFGGFEWDEAKSQGTRAERGFGFDGAARVFKGECLHFEDTRHDYGEQRLVAIGELEGIVVTVVWTPRGKSTADRQRLARIESREEGISCLS